MGHTADDILEARLMRTRGATTPGAAGVVAFPGWPQGRGVCLLRPLLDLRRAEIREWLAARGERWIDDPANESPLSIRAQARRDIDAGGSPPSPPLEAQAAATLAQACDADAGGGLRIMREALRAAPPGAAARLVSAACLCAAGTDRPPGREPVMRLAERLAGRDGFAATLAGARIEADGEVVRFLREAGEAARGGLAPLRLAAGETGVWDGRFEITADRAIEIQAAAGLRLRLSRADQATLSTLPASARDVVPVIIGKAGPELAAARPLARERLLAACGAIGREPA